MRQWDRTPARERAAMLEKAADLMEENAPEFMALCAREAGKTVHDAIAEVREAVDFLRYYALQARKHFDAPLVLPGPTGEHNELSLHGKGVFACISPWNFPLAIFTGQVSAALAAGNCVLAKPADQTPAVAALAVKTLHRAGIPRAALQLVPGRGSVVGARMTSDPRIDGVALTGSTETARLINRSLAARDAPLATFIAETGGQNAMLVDSSALPEQVVKDVIRSAFHSAGQRCSALRVLFLQTDVADRIIRLLAGAMQELIVGDPRRLSTDVGPVIDAGALEELQAHAATMEKEFKLLARAPLPAQPGRLFPRAVCVRDRFHQQPGERSVRAHIARGPLSRPRPGPGDRRHQRDRLRTDPRRPQPHRPHAALHRQPRSGRKLLHQPQHDRGGRRRAAFRRRATLRNRTQGGRSTLHVEVCHGTNADG